MKKKFFLIGLLLLIFKTEAQTSVLKVTDSILQTGNYQAALIVLHKVESPSFEILEKIGNIYQKVGNNTRAIEFYSKSFEMNPSDKVKEKLARSYQFIGNSDMAIELMSAVLEAKKRIKELTKVLFINVEKVD